MHLFIHFFWGGGGGFESYLTKSFILIFPTRFLLNWCPPIKSRELCFLAIKCRKKTLTEEVTLRSMILYNMVALISPDLNISRNKDFFGLFPGITQQKSAKQHKKSLNILKPFRRFTFNIPFVQTKLFLDSHKNK